MTFALFALFLAGAILSYVSNRVVDEWLIYVAYSAAGLLAVFFWLVPTIKHLNFYVELTTSRLIVRDGIFGQKTTELSLGDITSIELLRGRAVSLGRREGERLVLERMPRAKRLVAELRAVANLSA